MQCLIRMAAVSLALACPLGARAADAAAAGIAETLEIQADVVDAGEVARGTDATGTFVLKNVGARPIQVLGAKPACGCTVASYDAEIAPGQTGRVTATVRTDKFHGPIEKAVTVTTSDAGHPTVVLKIRANVVDK